MTAPRQPRHRLADDQLADDQLAEDRPADDRLVPAPADPVDPVDPPTEALPVIPSQRAVVPPVSPPQRAAVPQVFPTHLPAPTGFAGPGPSGPTPSWPARPAAAPRAPAGPRRRLRPGVLAGVTALVLVLGLGVVVVESGVVPGVAPISGE